MKRFKCRCGQPVFFENTQCVQCGEQLGFDPWSLELLTLNRENNALRSDSGMLYRQCRNWIEHDNCNWLIPADSDKHFCNACELNRTIPNLSTPNNIAYWNRLEHDKRRLIYTLLRLGLPVLSKRPDWPYGLAFDFIEDQRSNPNVEEAFVTTGHKDGVITINVAEADDVTRAMARKRMNESYRTVLGHFRHESGHYYFEILSKPDLVIGTFRELFGDERHDYQAALREYYQAGPSPGWQERHISAYATAHPLEDWAETWAHYLHISDSLETAAAYNLTGHDLSKDFSQGLVDWMQLTIVLNELNRSLGLRDPYPFVISAVVAQKLAFVHDLIMPYSAAWGVDREGRTA